MAANVFIPAQQISVGTREDGRFFIGLYGSGEHQLLVRAFGRWMDDGHNRNGFALGVSGEGPAGPYAAEHADCATNNKHKQHQADDAQSSTGRYRRKLRRRCDARLLVSLPFTGMGCLGFRLHDASFAPGDYARSTSVAFFSRCPCTMANTAGTKNNVATVANSSPPITARPNGAFCSPPSPSPSAMGSIPMIIAKAVINTGRMRV